VIEFDLETDHFSVNIWTVDSEVRGAFEHKVYGDEYGGGLWFEYVGGAPTLYDYDGIPGYVPREICDALEEKGFDMSHGRNPKDERSN